METIKLSIDSLKRFLIKAALFLIKVFDFPMWYSILFTIGAFKFGISFSSLFISMVLINIWDTLRRINKKIK